MASRKHGDISRRKFLEASLGVVVVAGIGCSEAEKSPATGNGGQPGSGTDDGASGGSSTASDGTSASAGGSSSTASGGTSDSAGGSSSTASSGKSAASGGTSAASGGKSAGGTGPAGGAATGGSTGSSTAPTGAKLVGLVRDTNLAQATMDAIAAAGGLPNLAGKTVLLKPNLLAATASPCTPNPEVVRGVIQAVKAAGATRILIGDSPAQGNAVSIMSSVGIHTVTQAEGGVTEVNFSNAKVVSPAGAAQWTSGINIYENMLDDGEGNKPYVINICCCKHHGSAVWSLAMKNWYGIVPMSDRKHVRSGTANQAQIAEIHLAVKEDFVVLDATKSYITKGPSNGDQASPGIVVATADAVAAEATGLAILRHYRSVAGVAKDDIENVKIFNTDAKTLMGRALTLGNGWITSREQYTYSAKGLGDDEAKIIAQLDA